jgi:Tfp pilus assembly protein PilN
LDDEIKKITLFYESNSGKVDQTLDFQQLEMKKELCQSSPQSSEWLISFGAAARGLLPRSQDVFISLMPIGTEEAYEHQKAKSFAEFIANLTIGLSIFFVLVFVSSWLLMNYLQQKSLSPILNNAESATATGDISALETRTKNLNALISTGSQIIKKTPLWSLVLEELKAKTSSDIYITSLSLPSPQSTFTISGIAKDRTKLNLFKKSLETSLLFANVVLPLNNLDMASNIPFSITLTLRDPSSIYTK